MRPFFVLALSLAFAFPALAESFQGRVVAISDDDTIRVLRGTKQVRVRLHGIDAPERKQAFGTRARQYAGKLAHEKLVRVNVLDTDRYGPPRWRRGSFVGREGKFPGFEPFS